MALSAKIEPAFIKSKRLLFHIKEKFSRFTEKRTMLQQPKLRDAQYAQTYVTQTFEASDTEIETLSNIRRSCGI